MKSLDHQSLEEQTRLVSRYVASDLSRSERAEFEALAGRVNPSWQPKSRWNAGCGVASRARRGAAG